MSNADEVGSASGEYTFSKTASAAGLRARERLVGGAAHLGVDLLAQGLDLVGRRETLVEEELLEEDDRVALGVLLPLVLGPVELLVVREGVRVGPHDVPVDERGALALAGVRERVPERVVRREVVAAVHLDDEEARVRAHEARDRAAGRVHLDGHRDRVAVVLDDEDDGQLEGRGGVQRLPELALGRRALADRHDDDLVGRRRGRLLADRGGVGAQEEAARLGGADARQALRAGRRRRREDVQARRAPVRRHLPPGGRGVRRGADGLEEHLARRHAEAEAERPVAVVREEPVHALLHVLRDRRLERLVARPGDLEEDAVLPLELDLLVVDPPGRDHVAEGAEKVVPRQPLVLVHPGRGGFGSHLSGTLPYAEGAVGAVCAAPGGAGAGALQSECGARFSRIQPRRRSR